MSFRGLFCRFWLVLAAFGASAQSEQASFDSSIQPSEIMPRAIESLLLDIVATDSGFVAVGERGHVLRSEDGNSWQQVAGIPTRSTLTSATSRGNKVWVAGHDQVIIYSPDGGVTWQRQHVSPDVFDPVSNSPLLDIHFINDTQGLAVGAYAAFLSTIDGGQSWQPGSLELVSMDDELADAEPAEDDGYADDGLDEEFVDYHLNAIAQLPDDSLYLAAEQGNAFRSSDAGQTWTPLMLPYAGSMFGALATAGDQLLTYGLRGNVFVSGDQGDSWQRLDSGSLNSLNGAADVAPGVVVMVGVNGEVLVLRDNRIRSLELADGNDIAAVIASGEGLIMVGEGGAFHYPLDRIINDR